MNRLWIIMIVSLVMLTLGIDHTHGASDSPLTGRVYSTSC